MKKKTTGRWMKDQKERKKQEIRAHNAQLHAAVSVAGVAAAVAALAATSLSSSSSPEKSVSKHKRHSKTSSAIASAAALVASHCLEIAEDMGADHDHILAVVSSAINARTNGDVMALTAGADWPAREIDGKEKMAYFAVQTSDRVIEFECRNKGDKELWVEGIQHMLHLHVM